MKAPSSLHTLLSASVIILASCNVESSEELISNEPEKFDQNIFGHGLERGVLLNSETADPGYFMFCPTNSASTYLMNRKGEIVHEWKGNYGVEGAYLGDDGSIVQNVSDPDFPVFAGGGESGRIQKLDWDSKMLWDFEYANEDHHSHHDFAVMPNGNILAIAWEAKSYEESVQAGRKPELTPKAGLWPDMIVEIEPDGKYHGKIVWEWHIWDHLIQDYDPSRDNYGDPKNFPGLMNINLGDTLPAPISQDSMETLHKQGKAWRNRTVDNFGSDMYHSNALNYNSELDQIAMSIRQMSEIVIIDHGTTTEEAVGHSRGRRGKGGDFLYRWGNPENYGRGDSTDRQLYFQHDIRWIEKGKPGAGNMTVFDNDIIGGRDSMNYSAVLEFSPPMDDNGNYILEDGASFGPKEPVWRYIAPDSVTFFAPFVSSAHRMKNGNTLVNVGPMGRFFEITPEGEKVWEYLMPYRGNIHKPNGDPVSPMPFTHLQFRVTYIPTDHPALVGRDLVPLDPQPEVFQMPPLSNDKKG
jgi:arylsulfotransferase ASST